MVPASYGHTASSVASSELLAAATGHSELSARMVTGMEAMNAEIHNGVENTKSQLADLVESLKRQEATQLRLVTLMEEMKGN